MSRQSHPARQRARRERSCTELKAEEASWVDRRQAWRTTLTNRSRDGLAAIGGLRHHPSLVKKRTNRQDAGFQQLIKPRGFSRIAMKSWCDGAINDGLVTASVAPRSQGWLLPNGRGPTPLPAPLTLPTR